MRSWTRVCALLAFGTGALVMDDARAFDHTAWDGLLRAHVVTLPGGHATRVDYAGMRLADRRLAAYLAHLARVSRAEFDAWSPDEQLAFLINAYNAATVQLITAGPPELGSIKELGSLLRSPWKKVFVALLDEQRSLDEIEHGLIRGSGRYPDPRIHFAVNCASIGCPPLREEAYRGASLDAQLEDQTQRFLADRARNRARAEALELSPVFDWYADDFAQGWRGQPDLRAFLAHYAAALGLDAAAAADLRAGRLELDFLDYDWALNSSQDMRRVPR